jgi:nitrite reductase (NADH) small subunit/3-phenylpropionate/trans-cinnamate dioxygenase ferredoxin subunit
VTQRTVVVSAGSLGELPPGSVRVLRAGDQEVAVFNLGGELCAVQARCLHRGGPLAEGLVRGGVVTCPWHWWRYDLRTGERVGAPWVRLRRYRAWVEGGRVQVEVPLPAVPASIREALLRHAREWRAAREGRG